MRHAIPHALPSPDRRDGDLAPNYHVIRRLLRREGLPYIVGTSYLDQRIVDAVGLKALRVQSIVLIALVATVALVMAVGLVLFAR